MRTSTAVTRVRSYGLRAAVLLFVCSPLPGAARLYAREVAMRHRQHRRHIPVPPPVSHRIIWTLRHPLGRRARRAIVVTVGPVVAAVGGVVDVIGGSPAGGSIARDDLVVLGVLWWLNEYINKGRVVVRRALAGYLLWRRHRPYVGRSTAAELAKPNGGEETSGGPNPPR